MNKMEHMEQDSRHHEFHGDLLRVVQKHLNIHSEERCAIVAVVLGELMTFLGVQDADMDGRMRWVEANINIGRSQAQNALAEVAEMEGEA